VVEMAGKHLIHPAAAVRAGLLTQPILHCKKA
jgi:hypothetical protein